MLSFMPESRTGRLGSLDAYRGLIMLTLASGGFGLHQYAQTVTADSPRFGVWQFISFHTDHPVWVSNVHYVGVAYWDLIQPAFMFMVGVAMPFSYGKRFTRGDTFGQMTLHAASRAILLVLLGVFLSSTDKKETNWVFVNVLSQIGLGYFFVYLLMGRPTAVQILAAIAILGGYWYWFVRTPVPGAEGMQQFAEHFGKNENAAAYLDRKISNWFPRSQKFTEDRGGYTTLNFVPSIVTMLLGVMSGELLRDDHRPGREKLARLIGGGFLCMILGIAAGMTACPIIKRIWTPSWVLFSGAYVLWMLAAFYAVIDMLQWKRWAFPLIVLGVNSILLYFMGQLIRPWVESQLDIHLGLRNVTPAFLEKLLDIQHGQSIFDGPYRPITQRTGAMIVFWLICLWLYLQRTFIRI
jgi:heparan-alpha-glucosaminide N-acetyltransferase